MKIDLTIVIKGAGEMASGVAWRLWQSGFRLAMTETEDPLAVRRAASFCEAVYDGSKVIEGLQARRVDNAAQIPALWEAGVIPVMVDPEMTILESLHPEVLVEATLAKRNTGINKGMAPLVIALGPGFEAGVDAHFVVETNRGHHMGRIFETGRAEPNTGIPGTIAGKSWERVLRSPADGKFVTIVDLGGHVTEGQVVATVDSQPVIAQVGGILRGMLRSGTRVHKDQKLGDVDPRGDDEYLATISDKARALSGSVLEAIMRVYNR